MSVARVVQPGSPASQSGCPPKNILLSPKYCLFSLILFFDMGGMRFLGFLGFLVGGVRLKQFPVSRICDAKLMGLTADF